MFPVDFAGKQIQPLDLTARPDPAHVAGKQSQADALQKLLPGWTVEPAKDFYHGGGSFDQARAIRDLAKYLKDYGGAFTP